MSDRKLEKLNKLLEILKDDVVSPKEIKQFLDAVVNTIKTSREQFENLSKDNLDKISEYIALIEENNQKWTETQDAKTNAVAGQFKRDIALLKTMMTKVKAMKPKDGEPGKDADEEKIVEDVLAKIKLPEYEVFTLEEKGEEIVREINDLPTNKDEYKIDFSHIKNAPTFSGRGGGGSRLLANLSDVLLTLPSHGQALVYNSTTGLWVNDNVSGSGGGSSWFFDQTPTDGGTYSLLQGDLDSVNQTFTVSEGQYISGSLIVILNGQVLSQGSGANEWVEASFSTGTFTLNTAPSGTDELQAFYTTTAGGGGGNAAGADTQVQFNDAGALNGDTTFTFNKTTNVLTVDGLTLTGTLTLPDNIRQTFNPGATVSGLNVGSLAGDPSTPINGDIWYDSTANELTARINGANVALGAGGGGGGNVTKVGTPVDNQIGIWTGDGTIEGDASLTYDGTSFNLATAKNFQIAGATILADAAGTTTLSNIDALDATTEATIESAIDTLANLTSIQGQTVTLSAPLTLPADPNADRLFFWDDSAGATAYLTTGNGLTITTTTIAVDSASDTVDGIVELAIASETTTGTDATRAVTPDGLAGSDYGKRVVNILVSDPTGSAITTGDGKACFRVPSVMNGWNLVTVSGSLSTVSSSGLPTFQIRRSRRSTATTRTDADMLSTKLSIDASEFDSVDATTAVVIDTANDDVNTGDMIYIDIDVAGTGAKGLVAELTFQLP